MPWSPTPTTCRSGAAPKTCSAPIRSRSRSRPAQEPPVVLDIATTVVSYGTVKAYKLQGKPMPEGWMVSAKDGKPLTDSAKQRRRPAAADRRPQGLRPRAGAGAAGRHAQRRGLRPRRDRFQRRRRERLRHRPFHHRARCRALPADRGVQGGDRPPAARAEGLASCCRASTRSAFPASSAAPAAPSALANGVPVFPEVVAQLDTLAAN